MLFSDYVEILHLILGYSNSWLHFLHLYQSWCFLCLLLQGVSVRVRRPSDYNPSMAATLGPSQPSGHLNLAAVGLTPGFGLITHQSFLVFSDCNCTALPPARWMSFVMLNNGIPKLLPSTKLRSVWSQFIHRLHGFWMCFRHLYWQKCWKDDLTSQITLQCLRWCRWPRPDLCRGFTVLS